MNRGCCRQRKCVTRYSRFMAMVREKTKRRVQVAPRLLPWNSTSTSQKRIIDIDASQWWVSTESSNEILKLIALFAALRLLVIRAALLFMHCLSQLAGLCVRVYGSICRCVIALILPLQCIHVCTSAITLCAARSPGNPAGSKNLNRQHRQV